MPKEDTFPFVSNELIKKLDEIFPAKEFGPKDDLREMDYFFGQRNIVNFLRSKKRRTTRKYFKID